jgi:hypothetical protein
MATPVQQEIGNPSRLTVASPPNLQVPQDQSLRLGFLGSARMDREMAREMGQNSQRSQKSTISITTALLNMSTQRLFVLSGGVVLLTVGLLALRFTVFLPDFDQWGFQINCGSGFQSALTQAGIVDSSGTHFVDQCRTAITMRRAWAFPLAVAGAVLLGALMVRPPSTRLGAVLPELPGGADDATVFDGATTPTNNGSDSRTRSARNVIQSAPASAA